MAEDLIHLIDVAPLRSEGSVAVFEGKHEDGTAVTFAVDHRAAREIQAGLDAGLYIGVQVPPWAILSTEEVQCTPRS